MSTLMESIARFCGLRDALELARVCARWRDCPRIARVLGVVRDTMRGGPAIDKLNAYSRIVWAFPYARERELSDDRFKHRADALLHYAGISRAVGRREFITRNFCHVPCDEFSTWNANDECGFIAMKSIILGTRCPRVFEYFNETAKRRQYNNYLADSLISMVGNSIGVTAEAVEFVDHLLAGDKARAKACFPLLSDAVIDMFCKSIKQAFESSERHNYVYVNELRDHIARELMNRQYYSAILMHYSRESVICSECIARCADMFATITAESTAFPRSPCTMLSDAGANPDPRVFDDIYAILDRSGIIDRTCAIQWDPAEGFDALARKVTRVESRGIRATFEDIMVMSALMRMTLPLYDDAFRAVKLMLTRCARDIASAWKRRKRIEYLARFAQLYGPEMDILILSHFYFASAIQEEIRKAQSVPWSRGGRN